VALVLDTAHLAAGDRADALREAMRVAGVPANVTPLANPADARVDARLNLWELDDSGTTLMRRDGTGIWLERTARQVKAAAPERLGLTLLGPAQWTFDQYRADHAATGAPSLVLVNQGAAYDHRRWGRGTTIAINVERDVLDVPMETVVRAGQNLSPSTPLHQVLCSYLADLASVATTSPHGLGALTTTTVHLVRAVVCAAAGDGRARDALDVTLIDRIVRYIDQHLADPGLGADMIAAAHHVSVRHLYNMWRVREHSLATWILHRRLDVAAAKLTDPKHTHLTIAALGGACGFSDPTNFGRRFRERFGTTPGEWRRR
jgi:AraC-like DNA-binding protein